MVNKLDYYHLAVSLDVPIKQENEENLQEVQPPPPKKRKRIIRKDLGVETFKYSCSVCDEFFKKKDLLDRHMFKHTGKVRKLTIVRITQTKFV